VKERVCQTKPRTLQKLKDSIRGEILSIRQETLTSVMECVVRRVLHCVSPWRSLTASDFQDIICEQSATCALSFPLYLFCKIYFLSVLMFEIQSWLLVDPVITWNNCYNKHKFVFRVKVVC
jgi:hypothetical protein